MKQGEPVSSDCKVCVLHTTLVNKVIKMASGMWWLKAVGGFICSLLVIGCTLVWIARCTAMDVNYKLDRHAGVQDQRIKNIEKSTARNEAALLRIEALLRDR